MNANIEDLTLMHQGSLTEQINGSEETTHSSNPSLDNSFEIDSKYETNSTQKKLVTLFEKVIAEKSKPIKKPKSFQQQTSVKIQQVKAVNLNSLMSQIQSQADSLNKEVKQVRLKLKNGTMLSIVKQEESGISQNSILTDNLPHFKFSKLLIKLRELQQNQLSLSN
eukprot:403349775